MKRSTKASSARSKTGTRFYGWMILGTMMLAAIVITVLWPGTTTNPQAETPSSAQETARGETERMAKRLRALAAAAQPSVNVYLNRQRAATILRELNVPGVTPSLKLDLRIRLALEHLRAGDSEDSIRALNETLPMVSTLPPEEQGEGLWTIEWFLGLAHLRLGEQQNCVAHHSSQSCLVPIAGGGIHGKRLGSEEAIRFFERALERNPRDLTGIWLLNLAYMTLGQYPDAVPKHWLVPPQVFESDATLARFEDLAGAAGVDATSRAGGVVMEDLDGDGLLDLLCSSWGLLEPLRSFHNQGDGTFVETTQTALPAGITGGLNLTHADYNNDGFRDALVLRGAWFGADGAHPNSLLRNNGDGTFSDVTESAGVLSFHPTQTAAWADYNRDGWLDLFIGNESDGTNSHPCELFHNNGDGTFTECAADRGVRNVGFVKGVAWGDINNDGWPDLFLSRLGQPNALYRNPGPAAGSRADRLAAWTFEDVTAEAGVAAPMDSFPCWFFDYDNDGDLDLFVASYSWESSMEKVAADYLGIDLAAERPRLYQNDGHGRFADVTRGARLDRVLVAMGANFGDLDNDGFEDLYIGTGEPNLTALMPNRMFRNHQGQTFQDVTTSGGFGHLQKGHGIAFGDLDQDGDQDIYAVLGGAYEGDVFQNALFANPGTTNHWITLRLIGTRSNRDAIGARIEILARESASGRKRALYRWVGTGGSFGSASLQQEIGLGACDVIESITVRWPSQTSPQSWTQVPRDRIIELTEGKPAYRVISARSFQIGQRSALAR